MRRNSFTLVEVVIALAILTGGLAVLLSMATQAQNRLFKSETAWARFHMLEQAAEYYLLQYSLDPEPPPESVFDYRDYQTACIYSDPEGIDENFEISEGQATLRRWTISLIRSKDRAVVDSLTVDRIDYEDE